MNRAEPQLERLQSLRFFAAAVVVVRHIFMEFEQHGITFPGRDAIIQLPWGAGVDVFFVISGFVITMSAAARPQSTGSAGDFLVRRLIRLWPTYALFTALMLVAMVVLPGDLEHPVIDPAHTAASFLFFPWPEPGDGEFFPVLGQGWTLNYEMFFYTCFAAVILAPARWRVGLLWGGGVALILAGLVWRLPGQVGFWANPIVLEFLFGVAMAAIYQRTSFRSSWMALVAIAGVVSVVAASLIWPGMHRVVTAGVPAVLIVGGIVFSGPMVERWFGCAPLATLGNASYALYLCHTFVVNLLLVIWLKLNLGAPWVLAGGAFAGSVLASLVVYLALEKPVMAMLKDAYKRAGSPRKARVVAAG